MADLEMSAQNNLSIVWSNAWQCNFEGESWKNNSGKRNDIQQRLSHFNSTHSNCLEHITKVFRALTRGVALTQTAINWYKPAIGQTKKRPRNDDKLRGIQWRLVIAYTGFEITTKALMNYFETRTDSTIVRAFIQKCELPDYELLSPPQPKQRENLDKWMSKEEYAIARFLGVNRTDTKVIQDWLVKSNEITSWQNAVKLAKALRNASAHGFLLPNKIGQWELAPALETLADNLGTIVACGLKKLT